MSEERYKKLLEHLIKRTENALDDGTILDEEFRQELQQTKNALSESEARVMYPVNRKKGHIIN